MLPRGGWNAHAAATAAYDASSHAVELGDCASIISAQDRPWRGRIARAHVSLQETRNALRAVAAFLEDFIHEDELPRLRRGRIGNSTMAPGGVRRSARWRRFVQIRVRLSFRHQPTFPRGKKSTSLRGITQWHDAPHMRQCVKVDGMATARVPAPGRCTRLPPRTGSRRSLDARPRSRFAARTRLLLRERRFRGRRPSPRWMRRLRRTRGRARPALCSASVSGTPPSDSRRRCGARGGASRARAAPRSARARSKRRASRRSCGVRMRKSSSATTAPRRCGTRRTCSFPYRRRSERSLANTIEKNHSLWTPCWRTPPASPRSNAPAPKRMKSRGSRT